MIIDRYSGILPKGDLLLLQKFGEIFKGRSFLHINSTRAGGGVAEILQRAIPILKEVGIDARWEVIKGDERFFDITKKIHNSLHGRTEEITKDMWDYHFEINKKNAESINLDADAALIHDPQTVALIEFRKSGRWIWKCHIDVSNPQKDVYGYLRRYCERYEAAIFSVSKFIKAMSVSEFIIPPSIDNKGIFLVEDE